ncbi:D-alanyl-D-alanine carboxypeptidase/D-alanyl-D-alanine endopeptidase [Brevibacillus sp. H7]|uniref:D-alanyl-D-alanine carboxypeptidase/D-alanyl-D-alanine endopeptidase n=1 Tax=Brevibacillus sp. H7 TaxID=3349138 RepID=UPI003815FE30
MNRSVHIAWKWLLTCMLAMHLAAAPAYAHGGTHTTDPLSAHVEKLLLDLTRDENSIGMHAGIVVYNLNKKEYLYRHNDQKSYVPASNMKLFTTMAALDKLGPEYQFKTEVYVNGSILPNGVVHGDLVLKGYGDPSLSVEDLQGIVTALKEKGITQINGNLLVDESYFDSVRLGYGWMWDDEPYGYSAQLSALAVHKNSITVTITPDKNVGEAPTLAMEPATSYLQLVNRLKIVEGAEDDITVTRDRGKNVVTLSGTIGKQAEPYQEDVTMEDPAMFVADVWKQQLEAAGIKLKQQAEVKKTQLDTGVPLHTHLSQPLADILMELNKESDNFYAEMLLKTLGATQKGQGSAEAGSEVVAEVLRQAGVETGYRQKDGSGLSRFNLITAGQMVNLLAYVQEKDYGETLEKTLPIAGVDGTLKSRLKNTPAENNLTAKTGSMGGVNSLSGYITAKNGDKLAFSILINGIYKSKYARDLQDKIAILLAAYPELTPPSDYTQPVAKSYKLSTWIDPILDQAAVKGVTAGVIVKALEDNGSEAVWYERDADRLLTPASNLKLLTSAAALTGLGEEYRFKTELYAPSELPKNGVLQGDLYVKGYGDPTLHTEDSLKVQEGVSVEEIAAWLKDHGVKKINGNLVLDESYFDAQRLGLGWAWDDESYYYNPLLGALALNRGTVMVEYEPGAKAGEPVQLTLWPKTKYVTLINEATTTEPTGENTFRIERDRATNTIRVKGSLPLDTTGDYERVPVEDPALYLGTVLKEELAEQGIHFDGSSTVAIGQVPTNAVKWKEFVSEPLKEIITYLNKKSDNFYAEMLTKAMGAVKIGEGSTSAGVDTVMEMIKSMGGNTNFDMVDGSGLTRYNLISARHIQSVLENLTKQKQFGVYYDSLPVAGVDGTLKSRMKGTAAENNVRAKTGTLTGVSSLSGYVTTKAGQKLAFSIILNGYTEEAKALTDIQDQIAVALASYED